MRITVITSLDVMFVMDVNSELDLETFKVSCELESGVKANNMVMKYQGVVLLDGAKSLQSYGINDGDIVMIEPSRIKPTSSSNDNLVSRENTPSTSSGIPKKKVVSLDWSGIEIPKASRNAVTGPTDMSKLNDPEYVRDLVLSNPEQLAMLKHNNPALANAAVAGDIEGLKLILNAQMAERERKLQEHKRLLEADPCDPEAQQLIAEEIRKENIDANMEAAMEYIPESFGVVVMLYINCKVNGVPVKGFIDSGAQATLMSAECAKRCNIMRLVDIRWTGIAKGVGVQKILGRVHMATIVIENDHLTTSFSVLEQSVDMLFGLDMLRRHQCCIDLKRNVLRIGTTGTETKFLSEAELPGWAKWSHGSKQNDDTVEPIDTNSSADSVIAGPSSAAIFPDDVVADLIAYGFPKENVLEELRNANGDKVKALTALFNKQAGS